MGGDSALTATENRNGQNAELKTAGSKSSLLMLAETETELPTLVPPEPTLQNSEGRFKQLLLGACRQVGLCDKPLSSEEKLQKFLEKDPLPDTAMDLMRTAFEEFAKNNYQMSPELDKKFKTALEKADGPSAFLESLKVLTPELQQIQVSMSLDEQKLEALRTEFQSKIGGAVLSPEASSNLQVLIENREVLEMQIKSTNDRGLKAQFGLTRNMLNHRIDKILPGTSSIIDSYLKQQEQISTKYALANQVLQKAMEDSERAGKSRWAYAFVLEQSGDDKGAARQLKDAAAKDQKLLENEEFLAQAERLGIDFSVLKVDES